jgi:hypothetical protein
VSIMGKINNLSVVNGIITNTGTTPGTLTMIVGDTNFSAPVSSVRESGSLTFNNDIGESATLAFYGDKANGQPAGPSLNIPGTTLFSDTGTAMFSPDSFAADHFGPFSALMPFSMTETASLNMLPGGDHHRLRREHDDQCAGAQDLGDGAGRLRPHGFIGSRRKALARFAF